MRSEAAATDLAWLSRLNPSITGWEVGGANGGWGSVARVDGKRRWQLTGQLPVGLMEEDMGRGAGSPGGGFSEHLESVIEPSIEASRGPKRRLRHESAAHRGCSPPCFDFMLELLHNVTLLESWSQMKIVAKQWVSVGTRYTWQKQQKHWRLFEPPASPPLSPSF